MLKKFLCCCLLLLLSKTIFSQTPATRTTDTASLYTTLMQEGDVNFAMRKYDAAIAKYKQAQIMCPERSEPAQRIAAAEKEGGAEAARLPQLRYEAAMRYGDAAMRQQKYESARMNYNEALFQKPDDPVAKQKLFECQALLLNIDYDKAMAKGDSAFAKKNWSIARNYYQLALGTRANDQTAQKKIAETEKSWKEQVNTSVNLSPDQMYRKAMGAGDNELMEGNFAEAKSQYEKALEIKAGDSLALRKIEGCRKAIALVQFDKAMSSGDSAVTQKNWRLAHDYYRAALVQKGDSTAQRKLDQCDSILAPPLTKQETKRFNKAMSGGKKAMRKGKCDEAEKLYKEAKGLKPYDAAVRAAYKEADDCCLRQSLSK